MAEQQAYEMILAELRQHLVALQQKAELIQEAIAAVKRLALEKAPLETSSESEHTLALRLDSLERLDAVAAVLRFFGRPTHLKVIARQMLASGYPYEYDEEVLRASLAPSMDRRAKRGNTFTKPKSATYGLIEWERVGEQAEDEGASEMVADAPSS